MKFEPESFGAFSTPFLLRLQAVGSDRTDAEGTYIPKINKNIYATGVPFSLTRNAEFLKETFGQWVDLDHSDSIKMIYEDGMYKGSIVVPVLEYWILRVKNFVAPNRDASSDWWPQNLLNPTPA